jgi:hypothetical protein
MLKKRLIHIALTFLVFVYIVFEELVWETIAKPIYEYLHSLKILKKIEFYVHKLNRYVLLILFLALFVKVELLGLYAVALLAQGKVTSGIMLYSFKIPIGAFTFWLFKVSKDKLMSFGWFKALYTFTMYLIDKIKDCQIYKEVKESAKEIKEFFKDNLKGNSPLRTKIKKIYISIKKALSS